MHENDVLYTINLTFEAINSTVNAKSGLYLIMEFGIHRIIVTFVLSNECSLDVSRVYFG